jgi:hypothetical protein
MRVFGCCRLTDADRRKPPKIGSIITYRFQEYTLDGVPRFPSYVGENRTQDTGRRTQDTGHRTQDIEHMTSNTRHRTHDTEHRKHDTEYKTKLMA